jgi:hypothetical protein
MKTDRFWWNDQLFIVTMATVTEPGPVLVHLPGLPNRPDPIPGITELAVGLGYTVIQPHYQGMFDSAGFFEPSRVHCSLGDFLQSAALGLEVELLNEKATLILQLEPKVRVSCHSYGTYVGINLIKTFDIDFRMLFFAPVFELGGKEKDFGGKVDLGKHATFVERAFPRTVRLRNEGDLVNALTNQAVAAVDWDQGIGFVADCLFVAGSNDPTMDVEINRGEVARYCVAHSDRMNLVSYLIADGGGHDVFSMLTPLVKNSVAEFLKHG